MNVRATENDQLLIVYPGERTLADSFERFHRDNPHVYDMLVIPATVEEFLAACGDESDEWRIEVLGQRGWLRKRACVIAQGPVRFNRPVRSHGVYRGWANLHATLGGRAAGCWIYGRAYEGPLEFSSDIGYVNAKDKIHLDVELRVE